MALSIFKKNNNEFHIVDPYYGGIWKASRYEIELLLNIIKVLQTKNINNIDNFQNRDLYFKYNDEEIKNMIDFIRNENISMTSTFIAESILKNIDTYHEGIITTPTIIMEVNRICNYRCPWCYLEYMGENRGKSLNIEEYEKKIIDPMLQSGTKNWGLTGGEPSLTLDKTTELAKIINDKTISMYGVHPYILLFTNGHMLSKYAEYYKKSGITAVQVSLSSADPEQEKILRRAPLEINSYNEVVNGIKECKKIGLKVILNSVITSDIGYGSNIENIPLLYELVNDLNIDELDINLACPSGQAKNNKIIFSKQDYSRITTLISEYSKKIKIDKKYYPPADELENNRDIRCGAGLLEFYVDYRGYTYPCNNLIDERLRCSNNPVTKDNISNIWFESSVLSNFRDYECNNINSECANCHYRGFCIGSCFARIWHQYGKLKMDKKPTSCIKELA